MVIKLKKELRGKLNSFLDNKDEKLNDLSKKLNITSFSFSQDEINRIEDIYVKNKEIRESIYLYIGEAVIAVVGGFWSIDNLKKDEAYGLPVILGWGNNEYNPRICPEVWLKRIDTHRLGKLLGDLIFSLKES